MRKKFGRKDDSFMVVDSAEIDLALSMTPAKTDDAAILYVDKGDLSIMHDLKTYTLSEGMLLIKAPNVIMQLLSYSEDSHFKVLEFTRQFTMAADMPIKHIEAIALIAVSNPVLTLDAVSAATVNVLFSLLQQKLNQEYRREGYNT
jgi:hypothetical protein